MTIMQTARPVAPVTDASSGHIAVEGDAGVLVARIDGGPHALFDATIAKQLKELVDRAGRDPDIHAVVFTGTHPDRFLSHSDVRWLQKGGTGFPPVNTRLAGIVARTARLINRLPIVRTLAGMTRLKTLLELDSFHATFLKMNASGTIFIAALNGSAFAVGAELAWACDLRIMADGNFFLGLSEVLLALTPGGGGSQRLPRLIGTQQALVAVLEGRPFTPAEALSLGAVDEVVKAVRILRNVPIVRVVGAPQSASRSIEPLSGGADSRCQPIERLERLERFERFSPSSRRRARTSRPAGRCR